MCTIFSLLGVCRDKIEGPYYVIYDRVISYYFKEPRQKERALQLLERACNELEENRALSCYNYGVILELEGKKGAALVAYKKANAILPHPLYRSAIFSLSPSSGNFKKSFLKKITKQKKKGLKSKYYKAMALKHPFRYLWDIELHLQGLLHQKKSQNLITREWQQVLKYAATGDDKKCAGHLKQFYDLLASATKKNKKERYKIISLYRGSALLIEQDNYFKKIRHNPAISRLIQPWLH